MLRRVPCYGCAFCASLRGTHARTIRLPDDGPRTETYRSVFIILMCKFYTIYICAVVGIIIEQLLTKIQLSLQYDENNGTSHKDQCTFLIIPRSVLLRMRNVSDKPSRQNQNAHFRFNNFFSKIYYTI